MAYFQDRGREDAQRWADEEAEIRQRYAAAKKQTHYSDPAFLCSRTKRPYRIPRYDEDGCPLTVLDLLFLLAVTVLRSEGDRWTPPVTPAEKCRSIIYLKTDYKVQAMMDALQYARDEGIERPSDIDERLDDVGAAYSRAKFSIKHNTELREKMAPLKEIVNAYEQTRATAERLYAMPDGAEKDAALRESQELLERHKEAKAALYRHHLAENDQIIDFNRRWFDAGENLRCAEERLALTKESYRKLKKLQYHAALARNEQFCYGAEYTPEKAKAAKPAAKKAMDR